MGNMQARVGGMVSLPPFYRLTAVEVELANQSINSLECTPSATQIVCKDPWFVRSKQVTGRNAFQATTFQAPPVTCSASFMQKTNLPAATEQGESKAEANSLSVTSDQRRVRGQKEKPQSWGERRREKGRGCGRGRGGEE